jgi:cytidine deaminase
MDKVLETERQKARLMQAAAEARENSYAPYSRFRVGAAVLTTTGRIFAGCNVENVSYGLTVCAERVALQSAVAAGDREIAGAAVITEGEPAFPCGACLQALQEFAGAETPVIIAASTDGRCETKLLSECLPAAFRSFTTEDNSGQ